MLIYSSVSLAVEKICVLSVFANRASEHEKVEKVFKNYAPAKVIKTPSYKEIMECFQGEYDEVIWLSHGAISGITKPYVAPIYYSKETGSKNLIFERFFENIANQLPSSAINLRVAFCGANDKKLRRSIDVLINKIRENGGQVDFSPKMELMSKIYGKAVTDLNLNWLSKSLDHEKLISWQTNYTRNCMQMGKRRCHKNKVCTSDSQFKCNRKSAKYIIPLESTF